MTVKIYVAGDSSGQSWAPDQPHEVEGILEIATHLWEAFHHLPELYALVVNLNDPSADLVVMTERGIGVVELKHYFGRITIDNAGVWYAGQQPIRGGKYLSPHKQVQVYAEEIRKKLVALLPTQLKKQPELWDAEYMFQTAVCFTNPEADITAVHELASSARIIKRKSWENRFSVIRPEEFTRWAARLRFGVTLGRDYRFEPFRLEPAQIVLAIETLFGGVEWKEAVSLMPTGEPYGYLRMEILERIQPFPLTKDTLTLGRDPDCDIVIPREFKRVSRRHCELRRSLIDVVIADLDSTRGTYVNGKKIWDEAVLEHGDIIRLGGLEDEKCCSLVFLDSKDFGPQLSVTEHTSLNDLDGLSSDCE